MTWEPSSWTVRGYPDRVSEPEIVRVAQIDGPDLYAVRHRGRCLNKAGEWELEPMPSSRTDAFLARCRFDTMEEAMTAAAVPVRAAGWAAKPDWDPRARGEQHPVA